MLFLEIILGFIIFIVLTRVTRNIFLIWYLVKKYNRKLSSAKFGGLDLFIKRNNNCESTACYDVCNNVVYINKRLLIATTGEVISSIVHEYRHSKQYTTKLYIELQMMYFYNSRGYVNLHDVKCKEKYKNYYNDPIEMDALSYGWIVTKRLGYEVYENKQIKLIMSNYRIMSSYINKSSSKLSA